MRSLNSTTGNSKNSSALSKTPRNQSRAGPPILNDPHGVELIDWSCAFYVA